MGLWSRLKRTFRGAGHADEIDEELRFHLAMDMGEGRDARDAHLRLGNLARIEEETRSAGILEWLDSALQDARYGLRQLRRSPGLVTAVVLSLTIGIGANTAIFSLIDAALLKPLPVKDPEALRIVEWTHHDFPKGVTNINGSYSPAPPGGRAQGSSVGANLHRAFSRSQTAFASLIGIGDSWSVAAAVDSSPAEQVSLQYVSSNFFQGLGVTPVLGRSFRSDEDVVGREPVVVVSHRFWVQRLAGRQDAPDRKIRINNVPARIIGVAPAGFFGLRAGQWTDVYAPLAARVAFRPGSGTPAGEDDNDWWVRQVARLRPDVPESTARAQAAGAFRAVATAAARDGKDVPELITLPGRRGFNALGARDTSALWILMVLVAVVLLIVCANIANLLLSRSIARQREAAVRLALGAARSRVFRQHLIESGILAFLGGAVGLAAGYVLAEAVHEIFQTGRDASNVFDLRPDLRIMGYTAGLALLTALIFGLAPSIRAAGVGVGDALKIQSRSVVGGRLRLPRLLVAVQVALSLTALVAAGLLGRSLRNLQSLDVGFDRENLAYVSINPWQAGYSAERVGPYAVRVRDTLAGLPGVRSVASTEVRLLSGNGNFYRIHVPGRIDRRDATPPGGAHMARIGEHFFETMRIPLRAGRTIEARDLRPNSAAVVVDESFVRQFFPNQSPLGRRFGVSDREPTRFEIIGVVADSRYRTMQGDAPPTIYPAFLPSEARNPIHFAIRASIDSGALAHSVRQAIGSVDPAVPMTEFHTQTDLIDGLLRTERLLAFLSALFGIVAVSLAGIGIGGLLAYAVERRTNEIGVRIAVGAHAADVVRMILRESFAMVGAGVLLGLPCVYVIGRLLRTALYGLQPLDPWTAALSCIVLLAIAMIAAWLPARRAAGIDPLTALREE